MKLEAGLMKLGEVLIHVDEDARTLTSIWPDGVKLEAKPVYDEESTERAKALGYSGECDQSELSDMNRVWEMTKDHDPFHHLVAQAEGHPWSWHLYEVAGGSVPDPYWAGVDGHREECLVLLMQRALNLGSSGLLQSSS